MGAVGPAKKSHSKVENNIKEEVTVPKMMSFLVKKNFLLNPVYHRPLGRTKSYISTFQVFIQCTFAQH